MMERPASLTPILPDLRRYALSLTRQPDAAADLVQDTCERALARADQFQPGSNLRAWCLSIMHNLHVDAGLTAARRARLLAKHAITQSDAWSGGQEAAVLLRQVLDAASRCGAFDAPLIAMDAAGATLAEMAAHYGKPIGTMKSRVHRSRKALREAVQWDHSATPASTDSALRSTSSRN